MASAATMTQMNVRLARDVKIAGDESLATLGLSPSQAVRLLWERASERGEGLEAVKCVLLGSAERDARDGSPLTQGWELMDGVLATLGLDGATMTGVPQTSDEDMLADAMLERLAERGLA